MPGMLRGGGGGWTTTVALQVDPVVCLAPCLVPHRHCHHSVLSGDDRDLLHGLHRASVPSAAHRNAGGAGSCPCSRGDFVTLLALPIAARVLPWSRLHLRPWGTPQRTWCAAERVGVARLSSPWRTASPRVFFLWVGTIERAALYSGLSTEIPLPSPQLKFSPEDFVARDLRPFRIIVLFLQSSGWCNWSHIYGSWSVNLPVSNNLVMFYSRIVHRKYCVR